MCPAYRLQSTNWRRPAEGEGDYPILRCDIASEVEVFTAWMQGHVSENPLRHALTVSGEMDRWDTVRLRTPEQRRLVEAFDAVADLLNSAPPGEPVPQLTRPNGLLRQVMDLLRQAGILSGRGL